ncbi:hypothetical protein GCM10010240_31700 [Streptomyces griseoviridis]|nr:hypothetical protein GCM10010240_31700 [Streptomyces griseoviridis]
MVARAVPRTREGRDRGRRRGTARQATTRLRPARGPDRPGPHPRTAAATAGPSGLVATAVVRGTAELYAYLSGPLGHLAGVRHVEASPFPRRVKQLICPRPRS